MMKSSGIENSLKETFILKSHEKTSYGYLYIVKIPYGLTESDLVKFKDILESNFAAQIIINRDKNKKFLTIKISL